MNVTPPGQEKVLSRSEEFDQILTQLAMIETSAKELPLRDLAQKYLQDVTLMSERAEEVFWKLLKIPAAYSLKVPVALRKEMVREALARLEIADQQTACWIFELQSQVVLLSPQGFSTIQPLLVDLKAEDTLIDIQGHPMEDHYRLVFRASGDLNVDPESPMYLVVGVELSASGVKPTIFSTGLFRQTCLSSWLEPVPNGSYYKAAGKPGKMTLERFKDVYSSLTRYATSRKDTRAAFVKGLQGAEIKDPNEVLSKAKTEKVLAKAFAKYIGSLVASLSLDSKDDELPASVGTGWDLIRVAIWAGREYDLKQRARYEKQTWGFTEFLLTSESK